MKTRFINVVKRVKSRRYKKALSIVAVFLSFAVLNLTFSCNYYKVEKVEAANDQEVARQIKEFNEMDKYIIVHKGDTSLELADVTLDADQSELTGKVGRLASTHDYSNPPETGKSYRYKKKKDKHLNEVHLYVSESTELPPGEMVSIPVSQINKIAVTDKNTGKTIFVSALTGLAVAAVVYAIVVIIILLTKSSCPYIYAYNGSEYAFTGELYPGNIIKNAQNIDFLKLHDLQPSNGDYRIKITNELLEIQHTDLAELIVIDHPENTELLLDPSGNPLLFKNQLPPVAVTLDGIQKELQPALKKDHQNYNFNSLFDMSSGKRNIVLHFTKPLSSKEANLYLSVKNSFWVDHIFGKFNEKFGSFYNTFQKQQQHVTRAEAKKWINEQNLPLKLYIKENDSWKFLDEVITAGPLSFRDIGFNIDLSKIEGEEFEIKLETGFMFWEVDYVAIDYPDNSEISIQKVSPARAIANNYRNVTASLGQVDDDYLTQAIYGDEVEIRFPVPPQKLHSERSVFLRNKGYYTYIRDYKGIPDFPELKKFREPGYFTEFSMNEYYQLIRPYLKDEELLVQAHEN